FPVNQALAQKGGSARGGAGHVSGGAAHVGGGVSGGARVGGAVHVGTAHAGSVGSVGGPRGGSAAFRPITGSTGALGNQVTRPIVPNHGFHNGNGVVIGVGGGWGWPGPYYYDGYYGGTGAYPYG